MTPPLRERLGWRTSLEVDGSALGNSAAMARAGFWLGASAALISLLAIVLPHSPELDEAGLAAVAVAAAALAAGALIGFDSLPRWAFHIGTAVGSVAATAAIYYWGETSFYGPLPLLWPAFFAFLFFPVREALLHVALMGALFAGELVLQDPDYDAGGGLGGDGRVARRHGPAPDHDPRPSRRADLGLGRRRAA